MPHYRWMGQTSQKNEQQVATIASVLGTIPVSAVAATKGALLVKGGLMLAVGSGMAALFPGMAAVVGGLALHKTISQYRQAHSLKAPMTSV